MSLDVTCIGANYRVHVAGGKGIPKQHVSAKDPGVEMCDCRRIERCCHHSGGKIFDVLVLFFGREVFDGLDEFWAADLADQDLGEWEHLEQIPARVHPHDKSISHRQ